MQRTCLFVVARLPVGLLVDDRVDRDGRLAGLAVADDQLTLAAADRDHGVDRLDAGLQRLVHALALHDAGRLQLERAAALGGDLAETVDRVAERVDDATEVARRRRAPRGPRRCGSPPCPRRCRRTRRGRRRRSRSRRGSGRGPSAPFEKRMSSFAMTPGRPSTCAMPSAASMTWPISVASALRRLVGRDEVLERVADLIGADREFCHRCSLSVRDSSSQMPV